MKALRTQIMNKLQRRHNNLLTTKFKTQPQIMMITENSPATPTMTRTILKADFLTKGHQGRMVKKLKRNSRSKIRSLAACSGSLTECLQACTRVHDRFCPQVQKNSTNHKTRTVKRWEQPQQPTLSLEQAKSLPPHAPRQNQ